MADIANFQIHLVQYTAATHVPQARCPCWIVIVLSMFVSKLIQEQHATKMGMGQERTRRRRQLPKLVSEPLALPQADGVQDWVILHRLHILH